MVVVTALASQAAELVRSLGSASVELQVEEGKRGGRLSELLHTRREVDGKGGLPKRGRVLVWCRDGARGEVSDVIPGWPGRGAKGGLFVSTTRAPATVRASTPMNFGGGGGVVEWIVAGVCLGALLRGRRRSGESRDTWV